MTDFRAIPSIEQLRQRADAQPLAARFGRDALVDALRAAADEARRALARGEGSSEGDLGAVVIRDAERRLAGAFAPSLQPVINATGVVLHTNLGRAPLAAAAIARVSALAAYSNLEYDLERGERGSRTLHAETLLTRLTGAEAAAVVNNNAAATLLMLAALGAGREVIISRGELVEIGGAFRVPDVMAQSGAILREVGTTNRTRTADYAAAINDRTALILRVHPSNFRVEGFTERPDLEELVALGRRFNIPVVEDLGSGALLSIVPGEPLVTDSVAAGVDVVCFSGDKLLGGPQAGILVGRTSSIQKVRTHPLMRALRVDKLTYAALEATLIEYLAGRAASDVPAVRMLSLARHEIEPRAQALAAALRHAGWTVDVLDGFSAVGGGSAPGVELPTHLVAIARRGASAEALARELRRRTPPVIVRIQDDCVVLDLRTVDPSQDASLTEALRSSPEL